MLVDQALDESLKRLFKNEPKWTDCVERITCCLMMLDSVMPSLNQADALQHLMLLLPNIGRPTPEVGQIHAIEATPQRLEYYFDSLYRTLKYPAVKEALSSVMESYPGNTKALFFFAGLLHEFYSCDMRIQRSKNAPGESDLMHMTMATDFLKIAYLLCDEDLVMDYLTELDNKLTAAKASVPNRSTSSFFFHWSKTNNFNQDKMSVLEKFIENPDDFFHLLEQKIVFKDKGTSPYHGAWTHLIQLYIITEENKKTNFLTGRPDEIYAYFAKRACRGRLNYKCWDNPETYKNFYTGYINAFDLILDRSDIRDARTPNFITARMMEMCNSNTLSDKTRKSIYGWV